MWTYQQSTGRMVGAGGLLLAVGYSGADPNGKNNPLMQAIQDQGPIPQGNYTFEEPEDTIAHGPYAMPLTPATDNEMFGRSGFLCHGDNIDNPGTASEGCIIIPRFARERIWESGDRQLQVIR